ncbi:MAG: hypothetical protein ACRDJC_19295 [Thermomicrobiales bacterium]
MATVGSGIAALLAGSRATAQQSTPCPESTPVVTGTIYDPNQPIGLGGTGNLTTSLELTESDAGEYVSFVIAYVGDGRFGFWLTTPNGDRREIFSAIHPSNSLTSSSVEQAGRYTLTVEADAPWTIIIR